ncbi:MAG TPA: von Willebrand factor type A domain-containing protein [Thermoanaerobaculia bacterium]|nr:von Willebrand factor type A domain-containing protein [Thermoanaerobaculia bacterium]
MSRSSEREVARRLSERGPEPEPPAELLARLKADIPAELGGRLRLVKAAAAEERRPAWGERRWLLAASIAAALAGGFLALEVRQQATAPVEEVEATPEVAARAESEADAFAERPAGPPPPAAAVPPPASAGDESAQMAAEPPLLDLRREAVAAPKPQLRASGRLAAPAQPVEVPEEIPEGVEGGIAGSVVGGVHGGVPGGIVSGETAAPLRVGGAMAPTTGGNAEPNDEPYGDVFFKTYGVNPFIDTEDDRLSTFGLDVDTASYTVARRYLTDGHLPPAEAVRVEEMVNAFDYADPAPRDRDFTVRAEGSPTPFAEGGRYRVLRFGIRAREVHAAERKPAVLTFVVDVSGSMDYENRLGLVKQALGLLLDELRPEDRVGLVVYGDEGQVLLNHTSDKGAIRRAIDRLVPEGSTNAEEGLLLGYQLAEQGLRQGAINRVILCSDGVANVGATGPQTILARIGRDAERGIELTTVGFGMGNYNDVLMEQLADKGDGRYAYVDTLEEARRVFVEDLTGTLQTVASQARAQVEFNPAVVARWRLLGYENRDIADHRFRDDTVDAGEIGAGHGVTALYEIKLAEDAPAYLPAATLRLRWRSDESERFEEIARTLRVADFARSWDGAPRALRLASVVAEFAEILRGSYWAKDGDLEALARRARRLAMSGDPRLIELAELIEKASELKGDDEEGGAAD